MPPDLNSRDSQDKALNTRMQPTLQHFELLSGSLYPEIWNCAVPIRHRRRDGGHRRQHPLFNNIRCFVQGI